mmetsp:Transcript_8530/g.22786  ORF Transcript_8530/g.22786 Transcript_8530/m.22786 type:complete len:249 (+) Transcript_8530:2502-3248(+)
MHSSPNPCICSSYFTPPSPPLLATFCSLALFLALSLSVSYIASITSAGNHLCLTSSWPVIPTLIASASADGEYSTAFLSDHSSASAARSGHDTERGALPGYSCCFPLVLALSCTIRRGDSPVMRGTRAGSATKMEDRSHLLSFPPASLASEKDECSERRSGDWVMKGEEEVECADTPPLSSSSTSIFPLASPSISPLHSSPSSSLSSGKDLMAGDIKLRASAPLRPSTSLKKGWRRASFAVMRLAGLR